MARVCTLLNMPRPERGYWAKLAVGKRPTKQPALPEPLSGDQFEWARGLLGSTDALKRFDAWRAPEER